jgi:hypothetical protein
MKLRAFLCLMITVSVVSCSRLPLKRVGLLQKFAARLGNELSPFEFSFINFHEISGLPQDSPSQGNGSHLILFDFYLREYFERVRRFSSSRR